MLVLYIISISFASTDSERKPDPPRAQSTGPSRPGLTGRPSACTREGRCGGGRTWPVMNRRTPCVVIWGVCCLMLSLCTNSRLSLSSITGKTRSVGSRLSWLIKPHDAWVSSHERCLRIVSRLFVFNEALAVIFSNFFVIRNDGWILYDVTSINNYFTVVSVVVSFRGALMPTKFENNCNNKMTAIQRWTLVIIDVDR